MLTEGMFIADRYEVLRKIGAGGMSDVYKAKDHVLGRFVAIKVLKQEFSEDVNFVTKFRTEAQSAAGLEHPNIVNIYDVGSEDGMHYIVMEYVEGITLKTYIEKKGQLSYKEAISIAIQVGRGIEAAHGKHIVHQDIKPQNIMISTEGKVKVMDFGIARAATTNTINSDVMGSVHYASPEQARNGYVDGKSDIYSLGIVMYEMVTGRVPFDGDTTVAVAIQHLQEEMVKPSAYAPDLPISLEKIILKCTQKNGDRRYQNIGDLLLDLKKSLISPNEDFVTMIPLGGQDKTRVIRQDELAQIQKHTDKVYLSEDDDIDDKDEDEDEDEDEEGILNPKMEKAVTIMGIAAAVLIIGIIVFIILNLLGVFRFGPSNRPKENTETQTQTDSQTESQAESQPESEKDTSSQKDDEMVTMVDVTNKTFDEAKATLEGMGLLIEQEGVTASDTIEEGKIVSQSVNEGEEVAKNTTIKVTVSSGKREFSIPGVAGYSESEAYSRLTEAGFDNLGTEYEYHDSVPQGNVIRTEPEAGANAKADDLIKIYLSRGPELAKVPDVRGKGEAEAREELTNAGLVVTVSDSQYNEDVGEGLVISQSIVGGKTVDKGTSISIVVSLGPKTVYYSYTTTVNVPADEKIYLFADITLLNDKGEELQTWKRVKASEMPKQLTQTDIVNSSTGTLKIVWTYRDEDGERQTIEDSQKVNFTEA